MKSLLLAIALQLLIQDLHAGKHELRLIDDLLARYNPYERPAADDSQPLKVEFNIQFNAIIDVDEKNQMIQTNMWQNFRFHDWKLEWEPAEYGNITDIRLPLKIMWKPDILLYNSADPTFDGSWPVNMVVYSTGKVEQLPPGIFTSDCPINIKWFPFDDQECLLKFGSWTYDGTKIDLQAMDGADTAVLTSYSRSGEWDLINVPVKRNVVLYDCCPDNPYIDLTFTIQIRRRKLYYMVNIVIPCLMLACLTLVTFTIPSDAGEKISFGVTILLSLTVFLLMVAEALPASSDSVPLIAVYFSAVMMLNAASVIFTVLVLNYHHRSSETHTMPKWVKKGICEWLAWILRYDRPGHDLSARMLCSGGSGGSDDVEMREPQSKSLLANVRDEIESPSLPRTPNMNGTDFSKYKKPPKEMRIDARSITSEFSPTRYELRCILKELRVITEKMRDQEEDDKTTSDWKFAANVVDRFLLWIFSIGTALASLVILLMAPNMFANDEVM